MADIDALQVNSRLADYHILIHDCYHHLPDLIHQRYRYHYIGKSEIPKIYKISAYSDRKSVV